MRHYFKLVWVILGEWDIILVRRGCMGHYFGWVGHYFG